MIRSMDRSPPRPQIPAEVMREQVPSARRYSTIPAIAPNQRGNAGQHQPGTDSRHWPQPASIDPALAAARAGDEAAFRVLYRDVQPRVLRYLQAIVGADADDVASETWLQPATCPASLVTGTASAAGWPRSPGTVPLITCAVRAAARSRPRSPWPTWRTGPPATTRPARRWN